ncbi:hypothetical protein PLESTB_001543400 [Pleodorina starrii]|uniref:Uncharacterized protein n=1 Tax=Pleodorina starrii TaxID=330485 RepID=A0A9W6BX57_9CHLO|nr:hypothetical protein PLESTB_001543400 [Pleodorina starrii]
MVEAEVAGVKDRQVGEVAAEGGVEAAEAVAVVVAVVAAAVALVGEAVAVGEAAAAAAVVEGKAVGVAMAGGVEPGAAVVARVEMRAVRAVAGACGLGTSGGAFAVKSA